MSSSVDKTEFNLNDGPATFTIKVRITDATGVKTPTLTVSHSDTSQSHGFGSMTLVSGTSKDGTYERTVTIPQGSAPGQWEVLLFPLGDTLGNSGSFRTLETIT
ncbi:hypothetical protein, partial [Arthrobacter sp. TB 23]|uniref:hypothetical protein n=1 Tax=Arthrobacter sp. TB 23 TaxID=494419 RepID=UPI000474A399